MQVISKTRFNTNTEKVTRHFYSGFKKERSVFLKHVKGIHVRPHAEWYASLVLIRLMFIYFIQKKGFLDRDKDYLKNKLQTVRNKKSKDRSFSFYRNFLLVLFHQGLGAPGRPKELVDAIGNVPYLQEDLFEVHSLEKDYTSIQIEDKAFENIFRFFDQYEWHSGMRLAAESGKDITPDVIGYIFEKYINDRASMGAYYTQEDITEYISKNCIIPVLFDQAKKDCANTFKPDSSCWQMLAGNPDRYIYDAVKYGCDVALPKEISKGIRNVYERTEWNKIAAPEWGLPAETWREVIERRARFEEIKNKLVNKELTGINDFITLNLNIRQFAQDVLQHHEDADFIQTFYMAMAGRKVDLENPTHVPKLGITILDPTCGSGAFLLAALTILEPLYETCIGRMEEFVEEDKNGEEDHPYFREVLKEMRRHPNRKYFIYKSIILNNLYGVDSMKEATEIAKLRLFLKLVATLEVNEDRNDLGLEPLPDIDFNIRTGNALIGFANEEQWRKMPDPSDGTHAQSFIEEKCDRVADACTHFKEMQWNEPGDHAKIKKIKENLNNRLQELNEALNKIFHKQYTHIPCEKWLSTHQPLHWFAGYYRIMKEKGGFDCIIGNPPYLEMRQVDYEPKGYRTVESGAVHTMCIERSLSLLNDQGSVSMIVPLSLVCTQRMVSIQKLLETNRTTWYSNYAWRPGKLFENVNRALSIFISNATPLPGCFTTKYMKWQSETRRFLMSNIGYVESHVNRPSFWIPKFTTHGEHQILSKVLDSNFTFSSIQGGSTGKIYYRTTGGLYWKIFTNFSPRFFLNGKEGKSSRETFFSVKGKDADVIGVAILSSNTYWWWYTVTSNLRDVNPIDVFGFRFSEDVLKDHRLVKLGNKLLADLNSNSELLIREQKKRGTTKTQSFKVSLSKPIIDEIDAILAEYYGFTQEELDFIINYDIKYRMGIELEGDEV